MPPAVLAQVGLNRGEHVLAAAEDGSGRWWLATRDALLMPDGSATSGAATGDASAAVDPAYRRLPWEDIDKAEWDRDTSRFSLVLVGAGRPIHVRFDNADDLLTVLRERVTTSIVEVRTVPLDEAAIVERVGSVLPGDAIVTVRRRSADRSLFTQVAFTELLDASAPDVQAAAEAAAAVVRSELGA